MEQVVNALLTGIALAIGIGLAAAIAGLAASIWVWVIQDIRKRRI